MMDKETINVAAAVCDEYADGASALGRLIARHLADRIRALSTGPVQPCGHPMSAVGGDGMTHWCTACAEEAKSPCSSCAVIGRQACVADCPLWPPDGAEADVGAMLANAGALT